MIYISGVHALNLPCNLETCGDWHMSALRWENIYLKDTEESFWGDWGIEYNKTIPENPGQFEVANHLRALLDLLEDGVFTVAQGMREDFICNEEYTPLVLDMVWKMRVLSNWVDIDNFMSKEYKSDWINFKENRSIQEGK